MERRTRFIITLCALALAVAGCNKDFETTKTGICGLKPEGGFTPDCKAANLDVTIPAGLDASNSGHTQQYQDSSGAPVGDPINGTRVQQSMGEWVDFQQTNVPTGADQVKVTITIQSKSEPVCFTVKVV